MAQELAHAGYEAVGEHLEIVVAELEDIGQRSQLLRQLPILKEDGPLSAGPPCNDGNRKEPEVRILDADSLRDSSRVALGQALPHSQGLHGSESVRVIVDPSLIFRKPAEVRWHVRIILYIFLCPKGSPSGE